MGPVAPAHTRHLARVGPARREAQMREEPEDSGGVDLPESDRDRVKSHLAKYYAKMDDTAPWERGS